MAEETFVCGNCGETAPIGDRNLFDEQEICQTCLDDCTRVCDHCGTRIWENRDEGDSQTTLCATCYNSHYTTCSRCERVIHHDRTYYLSDGEDEPLCEGCYNNSEGCNGHAIASYWYKPNPVFYGEGNRYMGVELEIDGAGECDDNAREVMAVANDGKVHVYCKHDGSLEEGFEIVTHPMTLAYHQDIMPWTDILKKPWRLGTQATR